jgi:hypothetical protein
MKKATALLVLTAWVLGSATACAGDPAAEKAAETAALSWLALVDEGRYAESWDAASAAFRSAVGKADWENAVRAARGPFGKLASRKLLGAKFTTQVPGAPAGEYVVIQYAATFAGGRTATETVTPMKEKDGAWKVSGYYIK